MGQVTYQVIGDGSVGTKTKAFTVPDADINRLVGFGRHLLSNPAATVTQALLAWSEWSMRITKEQVLAYERDAVVQPNFTAT